MIFQEPPAPPVHYSSVEEERTVAGSYLRIGSSGFEIDNSTTEHDECHSCKRNLKTSNPKLIDCLLAASAQTVLKLCDLCNAG